MPSRILAQLWPLWAPGPCVRNRGEHWPGVACGDQRRGRLHARCPPSQPAVDVLRHHWMATQGRAPQGPKHLLGSGPSRMGWACLRRQPLSSWGRGCEGKRSHGLLQPHDHERGIAGQGLQRAHLCDMHRPAVSTGRRKRWGYSAGWAVPPGSCPQLALMASSGLETSQVSGMWLQAGVGPWGAPLGSD